MTKTGRNFRHYMPLYCFVRLKQAFPSSVEPWLPLFYCFEWCILLACGLCLWRTEIDLAIHLKLELWVKCVELWKQISTHKFIHNVPFRCSPSVDVYSTYIIIDNVFLTFSFQIDLLNLSMWEKSVYHHFCWKKHTFPSFSIHFFPYFILLIVSEYWWL